MNVIAIVLVGFVMTTLGGALLLLGEVPFLAGKRIPALRARLIGTFLVMFAPLALGVNFTIAKVFGDDVVDGSIVTWVLCGLTWFAVVVVLFRVMAPKKEKREAKAAPTAKTDKKNPFAAAVPEKADEPPWTAPEPEPAPKKAAPGVKKPAKKPVQDENPFDFS